MKKKVTETEELSLTTAAAVCRQWLRENGVRRTVTHKLIVAHLEIWDLCLKVPEDSPLADMEPPLIRMVDNGNSLRAFNYLRTSAEQLQKLWRRMTALEHDHCAVSIIQVGRFK